MKLSARNHIKGTVKDVMRGTIMAKVIIDIGNGQSISAAITKDAVEELDIKVGDQVGALIKATSVMVTKD